MSHKLLIVGWGRSGKDCAAEFLHRHLGVHYCCSTSWAALPLMAKIMGVPEQMAWTERHQNRQFWKDVLDKFREGDPLLLIRRALDGTPDGRIVTGIRDKSELDAAKASGLFGHILWVDRPGIPRDPTVTFGPQDCTDFINNDGDLRKFHLNLVRWAGFNGLGTLCTDYAKELSNEPIP